MSLGVIVLVGGMAVIALSGIVFLIWGILNGQFKNIEEAKYTMLEDKEPEPWPEKKAEE